MNINGSTLVQLRITGLIPSCTEVRSYDRVEVIFLFFINHLICTEGALWLPTTYDNHPIQQCPSDPVWHIALNELNRPKIDLSQPSMTSNALWNKSNGSYDIKDFGPLPLIFSTSKYFRWKFQPCPSFFCMQIFQINEKGVSWAWSRWKRRGKWK